MKIFDFLSSEDRKEMKDQFMKHFSKKDFVPFFGSGFTVGEKTKQGIVPSASDLKKFIQTLLKQYADYTEDDIKETEDLKLANVSEYLIDHIVKKNDIICKQDFFEYLETRFLDVYDISIEKKQLLNAKWQYLYTLNYDDMIEHAINNLVVIKPYAPQNNAWLNKQFGLYKIHGDIKAALSTGDLDYCVLTQRQYTKLLKDDKNIDMVEKLKSDFASKNLIFFGCSLVEELDLLFVSEINLEQKKKNNIDTHCYYVNFNENNIKKISKPVCQKLEQYGVTDIINVTNENINQFYEFIADISIEADTLNTQDPLTIYKNISFSLLDDLVKKSKEYLFFSKLILPNNNNVVLPAFFTRRTDTKEIIQNINRSEAYIHILRGSNMSGKTYVLIDIVKEYHNKDIYFFPSGTNISDELLNKLISLKNAIIVFDEHSIYYEQMISITNFSHLIKNNNIHIIIAVNLSIGIFTKHYLEQNPKMSGILKITMLPSKLDVDELLYFNSKIGNIGLRPIDSSQTFLDYIMQIEKIEIKKHDISLPDINVLDGNNKLPKLKALLLFANQSSITITEMNALDIDNAIYELLNRTNIVMQKEYLSEIEKSLAMHDNFRFIVNSKYWVYRCLSNFADNVNHYNDIVKAFKQIVETYTNSYNSKLITKKKYVQKVKSYYFMDTIQFNFFSLNERGGSLTLLEMIYSELLQFFKDDYQFLHQKSKCLLRKSRTYKDDPDKSIPLLNDALQQLNRAEYLAKEKVAPNVEYTLYHMKVTQLLILINIVKHLLKKPPYNSSQEYLEEIVEQLYDILNKSSMYSDENEFDKKEIEDVKWFLSLATDLNVKKCMTPSSQKQFDKVVTLNVITKIFI